VADGHRATLADRLSYPACARDDYVSRATARLVEQAREREEQALASALRWREKAVRSWADNSTGELGLREQLRLTHAHADDLATQLTLMRQTVSWRVTAPLRRVRRIRSAESR
jgi:hypothetical protein